MGEYTPTWNPGVFDDRLGEQLQARCHLVQLLQVRSFLDHRTKGLHAARKNDLDSSRREFEQAEQAFQSLGGSESRLLCESLYCAALAYLFYRCDQPERARELVNRAFAIDTELEKELGVGALFGHKFHLVQNLVYVEARFGDSESATVLGLDLLEQLEGKPGSGHTQYRWSPSDIHQVPSDYRRVLANQIVYELAVIHLRSNARRAETRRYAEHVGACQARDEDLALEAHAWLDFSIAAETSDLAEVVNLSTAYLQRGPGQSTWLWYCVVLQCVERLLQSDSPAVRSAASAILRDRATWPRVPFALRRPFPSFP